jgi:ABC-type Mn2+/Zn2+ transport system permease subunit
MSWLIDSLLAGLLLSLMSGPLGSFIVIDGAYGNSRAETESYS